MVQTIILKGKPPSKKNSRQIVRGRGRFFSLPSANYTAWHEEQLWALKKYPKPAAKVKSQVHIKVWAPNLRPFDLDNCITSVLDLIKDAGLIFDDAMVYVPKIGAEYMGIDEKDPRVEIQIVY